MLYCFIELNKNRSFCLILNLRKTFNLLSLNMIIEVDFFINAIYQNDQVHFSLKTDVILSFHELVLNFNQYLTCIYWNDYIFSLYFVNVVNSIGWFLSGRSTLHCWHKSHLPRTFHCIIRFISCWIWFLNVSLPTIMYMLMKNVSLYVNKKC